MNALNRRSARCALFLLALPVFCGLGGCPSMVGNPRSESAPLRLYSGWVRFAGEFYLYADAKSFAESATSHCVSGALPPGKQQEAAAQFNGKRVRVIGKIVPWSLPAEALTMNNEGSVITNWCGDKSVLFATKMVEDKGRSGDR